MKETIIDLVLLGILIICVWSGYKKGLIMGVGGILCIIIAIYGGNLLSNTFSYDVVPAMRPFAAGYTEGMLNGKDSKVMKDMGWEDYSYSADDLLERYPERRAEFCAACYETLGIAPSAAETMADRAVKYWEENGGGVINAVVHTLCATVSYVGCFILAFLLIVIILTVLGNLPNLSFKLPRFDVVNDILGAILGLATGAMFCALLVWALKFTGLIIGRNTLAATRLGGWFLEKDFLFRYLGI